MHPINHVLVCIALGTLCGTSSAQISPLLKPKPLPADITPRVQQSQCGRLSGFFGPMDFRTVHPEDRRVVEGYHLDMEMATFLSGRVEGGNRAGTGPVAGGFNYTVRAMPNHPVAMLLLEQLGRKLKSEQPQNLEWPLECMYVRAFMLVPDDPVVWAMYGIYLAHRGRSAEAIYQLDRAQSPLRNNGTLQFQIGWANVVLKRWEQAQINAMLAFERGFDLPGLRDAIKAAGKWRDDLVTPKEEAAAPTPADMASAPSQ